MIFGTVQDGNKYNKSVKIFIEKNRCMKKYERLKNLEN